MSSEICRPFFLSLNELNLYRILYLLLDNPHVYVALDPSSLSWDLSGVSSLEFIGTGSRWLQTYWNILLLVFTWSYGMYWMYLMQLICLLVCTKYFSHMVFFFIFSSEKCIYANVLKMGQCLKSTILSNLHYKLHLNRQCNCWALRSSWSITCQHCSNYIFIPDLNTWLQEIAHDNYKMRWETFKFWDLVWLILDICQVTIKWYQFLNMLGVQQSTVPLFMVRLYQQDNSCHDMNHVYTFINTPIIIACESPSGYLSARSFLFYLFMCWFFHLFAHLSACAHACIYIYIYGIHMLYVLDCWEYVNFMQAICRQYGNFFFKKLHNVYHFVLTVLWPTPSTFPELFDVASSYQLTSPGPLNNFSLQSDEVIIWYETLTSLSGRSNIKGI